MSFDAEALGEDAAQREVAVGHGGLGHLLAVVLRDRVLGDAGAEAHGRLEGLAVGAGLGLHDDVGGGHRLALAVGGEDRGRGAVEVPALVDGLRLDGGELAGADLADLGHAAAFGLDGLLGGKCRVGGLGGRHGRLHGLLRGFLGGSGGLRRDDGLGVLHVGDFGFHAWGCLSCEVQGGRDVHSGVTIRPDRDHGHFA